LSIMAEKNGIFDLVLRYLILIAVAIPTLWLFYTIFTPLTVYPVYWILGIFYDTILASGHIIILNNTFPIELIPACIAGSAYYLLFILNVSTREISFGKRIKMLLWAFGSFLVLNILRIIILSVMAFSESTLFPITHVIFWYAISTIFVVAVWFAEVKAFNIKEIPFYSDIIFLYKKTKTRKRRNR